MLEQQVLHAAQHMAAAEGHRLPWSSMNGTVFCADDMEQQVMCCINMVECYTPR
jgi:hypothetical protein